MRCNGGKFLFPSSALAADQLPSPILPPTNRAPSSLPCRPGCNVRSHWSLSLSSVFFSFFLFLPTLSCDSLTPPPGLSRLRTTTARQGKRLPSSAEQTLGNTVFRQESPCRGTAKPPSHARSVCSMYVQQYSKVQAREATRGASPRCASPAPPPLHEGLLRALLHVRRRECADGETRPVSTCFQRYKYLPSRQWWEMMDVGGMGRRAPIKTRKKDAFLLPRVLSSPKSPISNFTPLWCSSEAH